MRKARAVFLDRDGTLIEDTEYLSDPDGIILIPGAVEALRRLRAAGFTLVTVTNQAGIARGYYTVDDYHAVATRLDALLAAAGVGVDRTFFCPHHPDFGGPCRCRKPGTGMYEDAAAELGIDLSASYYVGDKVTDAEPALTLGGQGVLVRTGYGSGLGAEAPDGVWVVDDLLAAVGPIVEDAGS